MADTEVTEVTENQEVEVQEEPQVSSVEELASQMGWRPEDEWDSSRGEWRDAATYIMKTNEISKDTHKRNKDLNDRLSQLQGTVEKMVQSQTGMMKRAVEQAKQRAYAEMRAAVEEGDTQKYAAAEAEMQKLNETQTEQQPQPQVDQQRMQQFQSGFEDFRRRNPWYGQDRIMSSAADMAGEWLLRNDPNVSPDDYYSFVEEKIREDYPGRMSNPNKQRQSVSSPRSPSKEGGTAWEKVTRTNPELKEAFSEWVEMGTFKDTKEDREKYAKMYLEAS